MLALLPITAFVLIFAAAYQQRPDWREAFLTAATLWAVVAVAITEALGLPSWLTVSGISVAWVLVIIATCAVNWRVIRGSGAPQTQWKSVLRGLPADCRYMVAACGVIAGLVAAVALLSAPNTADAMHYHLPRIVHWLQNKNVGYWPTANYKQLYLSPGEEYLVVHFHALIGGDTLDSLVQWFSMVASVIGVSLVARELGASVTGQVLASLICVTIPEGILESSGPKNDYTITLWVVALAYYLLSFRRESGWQNTILIGLTLGLSYLTKTTAVLFAPWIIICIFIAYSAELKKLLVRRAGVIAAIVLLINAPPIARNLRATGSLTVSTTVGGGCNFINQAIGLKCTLANIARNLALHADTPSAGANAAIESGLKKTLGFFGISADDPQCTWCSSPFRIPELSSHEALAPNSLHLILLVACLGWLLFRLKPWQERLPLKLFSLSVILSALSFCAILTWQPWHTRLHLPLFALGSALAGTIAADLWPKYLSGVIAVLLIVASAPFALQNEIRPLLFGDNIFNKTREELYFGDRGAQVFLPYYRQVAAYIKKSGCKNIGLDIETGGYEYPMLALLDGGYRTYVVRHMPEPSLIGKVANDSKGYSPCSVICFACTNRMDVSEKYEGPETVKAVFGDNVVYSRAQDASLAQPVTLRGADGGWILSRGVSLVIDPAVLRERPRITIHGQAGFQWPIGTYHDIPLPAVQAHWWVMGGGGAEVSSSIKKVGPEYEIIIDLRRQDLADNRPRSIELRFDRSFSMVQLGLNPDTRPFVLPAPFEITTSRQ